jgi:hypothetical protein
MSKSEQPIEFVQASLAQLPIIEVIIQQAVGQLPNIEDIRHSSRSLKIYSQLYSFFKQILGLTTQKLIRNSITNKNLALTTGQILGTLSQEFVGDANNLLGSLSYSHIDKNMALVEYATANEKDRLFVSKYKLNLPSEQDLKMFVKQELQRIDGGDA